MTGMTSNRAKGAPFIRLGASGVALAFGLVAGSVPALAQDAGAQEDSVVAEQAAIEGKDAHEIVVTGTLIRGVKPTGANLISFGQADVQATGITSSAQVMEQLPQFGAFNQLQFPVPSGGRLTTNRPNLRSIPGFNTSGSSTTLVLMNGHRLVGMGIQQTSPDPDVIPAGALERLDIVPDGGSATYGSDAVAGVMNYLTRRRYDGLGVDAKYGFADDYHTWSANATFGKEWATGSAMISYSYSMNTQLLGASREYVRQQLTAGPTNSGFATALTTTCAPGNTQKQGLGATGFTPGAVYALSPTGAVGAAGTLNQCDVSGYAVLYPEARRHSVLLSVDQELSDAVKVGMTGYYFNRRQYSTGAPLQGTSNIGFSAVPPLSVFTSPFLNFSAGAFQTVSYQYGSASDTANTVNLESWGVTPELTVGINDSWQLRTFFNYGWSRTVSNTGAANTTALNAALPLGLFNPYAPSQGNQTVLDIIRNFDQYGEAVQSLYNVRAVLDGTLFHVRGGDVKLAVGAEYNHEGFRARSGNILRGAQDTGSAAITYNGNQLYAAQNPLAFRSLDREVKAVFAELNVPVIGAENAVPGFQEFVISLSGRYDDYSDFGDTFNPKVGVTYKPFNWLTLRGAWGKSFNAPSLANDSSVTPGTAIFLPANTPGFSPPASLITAGRYPAPSSSQTSVILLGSAPGLQPQKATTFSLGFDADAPGVDGLRISATYYSIDLQNQLGQAPWFNASTYFGQYSAIIPINPSVATVNAQTAGLTLSGNPCATDGCYYTILDGRTQNLGDFKTDGIDMSVTYNRLTSFGSINFSLNGNRPLSALQSTTHGGPKTIDLLAGNPVWKLSFGAGATAGNFTGRANVNFSSGYDLVSPVGAVAPFQTHVDAFTSVNLFFKYDVKADWFGKDLSLTLNVNNLFDKDPPFLAQNNGYATSSQTLGRQFTFGIDTKF